MIKYQLQSLFLVAFSVAITARLIYTTNCKPQFHLYSTKRDTCFNQQSIEFYDSISHSTAHFSNLIISWFVYFGLLLIWIGWYENWNETLITDIWAHGYISIRFFGLFNWIPSILIIIKHKIEIKHQKKIYQQVFDKWTWIQSPLLHAMNFPMIYYFSCLSFFPFE